MVERAKIVLKCAEGVAIKDIAAEMSIRQNTEIKWRDRFSQNGLSGLEDAERDGVYRY